MRVSRRIHQLGRRAAAVALGASAVTVAPLTAHVASAVPLPAECSETTYTTFDDLPAGELTFNGAAAIAGPVGSKVLRVTPSAFSQAGSAFTTQKLTLLGDGSFSTKFAFRFTSQLGGGADGLVFVVQNVANNVGGLGGGIGYLGLGQSVGVEFDNWFNGDGATADINDNHAGINVNGSVNSDPEINLASQGIFLDNGAPKYAWVDYNGATDVLEVRLSNADARPATPMLTKTIDIPATLGPATPGGVEEAFVGFTSGTGAAAANHDVLSWTLSNCYNPVGVDNPPDVDAGGPYAGAEGSAVALSSATATDDLTPVTSSWTAAPVTADSGASCTFTDAASVVTDVTCTDDGTYQLSLEASDGANPAVTSTATLTVSNESPDVASVQPTFTSACAVDVSAPFTDAGTNDTHTGSVDWGDGSSTAGTVTESAGAGTATAGHTFTTAGTHPVVATVTDDDGGSGQATTSVTTMNRAGAFLPPINASGDRTVFRLGSTIPIKIEMFDCAGNEVTGLAPSVDVDRVDSTTSGGTVETPVDVVPTNGHSMEWDGAQYHFNLSTKRSQLHGGTALAHRHLPDHGRRPQPVRAGHDPGGPRVAADLRPARAWIRAPV